MVNSKEYIEKNREKIKDYMNKYYLEHKQKFIDKANEWRKNNPERSKEFDRKRNNTIRAEIRRNRWIERNPEKNRISKLKYIHKYREDNKLKEEARRIGHTISTKRNCEICGSSFNLQRHHFRYDKPLLVNTLCSTCHKIQHIKHFDSAIYRGGKVFG